MKPVPLPLLGLAAVCLLSLSVGTRAPEASWTATLRDDSIRIVTNPKGSQLGYSVASGVTILTVNGLAFKDLNKNGTLDAYEDWRLPVEERARDLAAQLPVEGIAGLMLYSRHQSVPTAPGGPFAGTYGGNPFPGSGAGPADLSDQQVAFLTNDHVRHVLIKVWTREPGVNGSFEVAQPSPVGTTYW